MSAPTRRAFGVAPVRCFLTQPAPEVASKMAGDFVSGIVAPDEGAIILIALDAMAPPGEERAVA